MRYHQLVYYNKQIQSHRRDDSMYIVIHTYVHIFHGNYITCLKHYLHTVMYDEENIT